MAIDGIPCSASGAEAEKVDEVDADFFELGAAELKSDAVYAQSDPGHTIRTATDLGTLETSLEFSETITFRDRDLFRFEVDTATRVELELTNLAADIDLHLYNAAGSRIARSIQGGSADESIQLELASGVYYAMVRPWGWAFSDYTLDVTNLAPPPSEPPSTPEPPTSPSDPPTSGGTPTVFPDVAYFGGSREWNLNAINAPEAWAQGYTGEGVVVAIIDTGVDLEHADLTSSLWVNAGEIAGNGIDDDGNGYVDDIHGWDFVNNDNRPDDLNGHGTHVAGTIGADNNGFGATGVAPDAVLMPIQVLSRNGSGSSFGVAQGIRYAAENGADIINLSLGGGFSNQIFAAIRYAEQLGSTVIAAAGNESSSTPGYPARFSSTLTNVLSVGAHSSSGAVASFSNDVGGSGAIQVDAPGVGVFSTYANNRYAQLSGTSMAAPHVAGLAALALSANADLSPGQLRSLIVDGADRTVAGSDAVGGVNAATTVAFAAAGVTGAGSSSAAPSSAGGGASASAFRFNGIAPRHAVADSFGADNSLEESNPSDASDETEASTSSANRFRDQAFAELFSGDKDWHSDRMAEPHRNRHIPWQSLIEFLDRSLGSSEGT